MQEREKKFRLRSHLGNLKLEMRAFRSAWSLRQQIGKKSRFVVYARARSGATLLLDLLDSHPEIQCGDHAVDAELMLRHWFFPYRYAENKAILSEKSVYGFKLKPAEASAIQQTEPSIFLREMHRRGWKIIHLQRHNIVRQALSVAVAIQSGIWHHRQQGEKIIGKRIEGKVHVLPEKFLTILDLIAQKNADENSHLAGLPHLSLSYESDLQRAETQNATANRVFDFLGLPHHETQTEFMRTSSDDLRDTIENADEIIELIRNTKYAHFLDN